MKTFIDLDLVLIGPCQVANACFFEQRPEGCMKPILGAGSASATSRRSTTIMYKWLKCSSENRKIAVFRFLQKSVCYECHLNSRETSAIETNTMNPMLLVRTGIAVMDATVGKLKGVHLHMR